MDYLVELKPAFLLATVCRECRSKPAVAELIVSTVRSGRLILETRTFYCADCAPVAKKFMHDNCRRRLYGQQASRGREDVRWW